MAHTKDDLINGISDSTKFAENEAKRNIKLLSALREWSIKTIDKHMPGLDIDKLRSIFDPFVPLDWYGLFKQEFSDTDYRDFKENESLRNALYITGISNFLLKKAGGAQLVFSPAFRLAFDLGRRVEKLASVDPKPEIQKLLEDHYLSSAGKKEQKKRWDPHNALMENAKSFAKEQYQNGSKLFHNEMTDWILDQPEFEALKARRQAVLRNIRPVADKYGRVKGKKGVKK